MVTTFFKIVTIVTIVTTMFLVVVWVPCFWTRHRVPDLAPDPQVLFPSSIPVPCCPIISHYCLMGGNLWYFNTATENCPLTDVFHHARPLIGSIPLPCLTASNFMCQACKASCSQMAACLNGPCGRGVQVWSWDPRKHG